jgi:phospholipase C
MGGVSPWASHFKSLGQTIALTPITLANSYDLDHSHAAFVEMYDSGKMDGANQIRVSCTPNGIGCPPPNPQFMYVNPSEVTPYFQLAERYTFGDRMFQTNQGPSFPAHHSLLPGLLHRVRPVTHSQRRIQLEGTILLTIPAVSPLHWKL